MPKRYIRGDKVISNTTPPPVLLVLRRKPPTPLDSYSPQGAGRRQYRQKMPRWCSEIESPNITGTFAASYYIYRKVFDTTGAFTEKLSDGTDGNTDGHSLRNAGITFNASNGNSIYQGATVQSPAVQTLIIIKVWKAGGWITSDFPYIELLLDASNPKLA